MEQKKLNFSETLADSFKIGIKNAPSIIGAILLWIVTIWVPYINIGTTIAISLLPIELAKGNVINPLGIFSSKYRRYMGEYLITYGLMIFPIFVATLFMIVPGIVLSIAWSLAFFFLIDKGKNPIQAIKASNDATYGSKWMMFFSALVLVICIYIVTGLLALLFSSSEVIGILAFALFVLLIAYPILLGYNASVWKQLKDNVE